MSEQLPNTMEVKIAHERLAKEIYRARLEHSNYGPTPHHLVMESYVAQELIKKYPRLVGIVCSEIEP